MIASFAAHVRPLSTPNPLLSLFRYSGQALVYGAADKWYDPRLPLGSLNFKDEAGVLRISDGQLVRLRHHPFFPYLIDHQVKWLSRELQSTKK